MIQIKKAVRERIWLKIATMGPSGAGKTYGSIALAKGLAQTGKVLVVDTENSSASYYADKWDFDVVDMHAPFTAQKYMEVLQEAVRLGYEVIVFDSLSHEWAASGGVLDKKADFDRAKGEKWGNWQDAKKPHTLFREAWLQAPIHVVATMRSKMEYVLELSDKGKQVPRKVGLAPIQEGDSEYEFGIAFEIDRDSHLATASKDRTGLFDGRSFVLGEAIGQELLAWRDSGAAMVAEPVAATPAPVAVKPTTQPAAAAAPKPATAQAPATRPVAARPTATVAKPQQVAARPTQAAPASTQKAAAAQSVTNSATSATAPPSDELPPEWVTAMVELSEITMSMPTATRAALVADFEAEGPAALPALLEEIAKLKSVLPPTSEQVANFVDDLDPRTDESDGGISGSQYEALNQFVKAYGLNRDALRSYMAKAGHLLPGKNGPTLARMKNEAFVNLRTKLTNQKIAGAGETWSARTVRIINSTPITTFAPVAAAS